MEFSKKLNLLPQTYKDRYANRYIMLGFGAVAIVLVLMLTIAYINLEITKFGIKKLTEENIEYQIKQSTIAGLEKKIVNSKEVISEYQKDSFPFYYFMQTVENQKPSGLTIISIDSADRLTEQKTETVASTAQGTMTPEPNEKKEAEKEESAETITAETKEKTEALSLAYEKDLSGGKLVIRGYSFNPSDIATFINDLSKLPYVADTELKAIEEHTVNGVDTANIFEAILQLK